MKMAKKVLSVVLSVLMALSCFAVAASAWGDIGNAEHNVTVSLGLSKGYIEWTVNGSKVTCETDDPAEAEIVEGNIYAKPGDVVWVYQTVTTDYYVWGYQSQVFYSAALIDAFTDFKTQTGKTSMTAAQEPLVHQFNADNVAVASMGTDNAATAPWGKITATNKKNIAKAWPTDESGTILAAYAKDGAADQDTWAWARMGINMDPGSEAGVIWDDGTWLCRFPVIIPAGAKDGTVYTLTIPEEMIQRTAKKTSVMYCSEIGNEGAVDGENELAPVWSYPTSENSGEQSWDLSAATVTITVGEEPEEGDELDFTALDTALAKLPDEFEGYTTSSVDAVIDAAEAAQAAYNATTQDEIDAAAAALETALAGLTAKADMTDLEAALDAAANVDDIADWYELSVDALEDAVAAGQAIIAQADEYTDQAAVDAAAAAINDILSNHTYGVADYSALEALDELIAQLDKTNYTISSWTALEQARDAVVPGLLQSKQGQVDEMIAAVEAAFNGLKEVAYTASLEMYVAQADAADEDDYAADVWAAIQDKVALANTYIGAGLAREDVQADIDALAIELIDLLNNKLADADYTAVEAAFANIPADIETGIYTEESVAALDSAAEAVVWGLKEDQQAAVDKMAADINAAVEALEKKGADYEYVDKYVNQAAALERNLYTDDSLAALDAALAAVVRGLDITHQDEVTGMANDIYAALDALEMKGADYSAVETALAKVPADSSLYTAESWSALEAAIGAVVYGKDVDEQAAVDAMAEAIEIALAGLVDAGADYSAIEALLATAPTANQTKSYKSKIDNSTYEFPYYTVASYAAFDAAKNAVELGKLISQQGDVDAWAEALEAAINGLVPAGAETYVNYFEGKKDMDPDLYTAESWATYAAAKEEVLKYTVKDNWSKIGGGLSKANTGYDAAYMALELKPVVVPADYTAFSATIIEAANINKDMTPYTSASADAFYAAFNNAQLVPGNLTSDDQAIIDNATNALIAAINGLKAKADLTALNDALAAAYDKEADKDLYTEESWDVLAAAVADGEAFTNSEVELTAEADQKNIDDAAAAILAAIDALDEKPVVGPADFTALEAAVARLDGFDLEPYTEESVMAVGEAYNEARIILRDKDIITADYQADVDAAAKALNDAIDNLKLKPTEPEEPTEPAGFVKSIDFEAEAAEGYLNDYTIKVEGRPMMVQFYEVDNNGVTNSFDRKSDKVSITSYDKDGNVVDSMNVRVIAYEVWELTDAGCGYGEIKVRAKANGSSTWEPITDDTLTFENVAPVYDVELKEDITAPESGKPGAFPITVVVGKDAKRVQVKMADGSTNTSSTFTDNGDGTLTCVINGWANLGDNTVTVRVNADDGSGWKVLGTVDYTASDAVIEVL